MLTDFGLGPEESCMSIEATKPSDMRRVERDDFIAFVRTAGEVDPATLPNLVDRAVVLVTLREGEALIGTAAIKKPNEGYRRQQFSKANVEALTNAYALELGWVHVHPDHRKKGHGHALVAKAVEAAGGEALYATTKNEKMRPLLEANGFSIQGSPYPSVQDPTAKLTLFCRPA
jgi:GNAT superfamily N-acetyltransferase